MLGLADDEDFAEDLFVGLADGDGECSTSPAVVRGVSADEAAATIPQKTCGGFAGGHGQVAFAHGGPGAAEVGALRDQGERFGSLAGNVKDVRAVHDDG